MSKSKAKSKAKSKSWKMRIPDPLCSATKTGLLVFGFEIWNLENFGWIGKRVDGAKLCRKNKKVVKNIWKL